MSWLAKKPGTPRPPFLSNFARLIAMSGVTTVMGTTEMAILIAHLAARRLLPKERKYIQPSPPERINLPPGSPQRPPRSITLDHQIARRLLYAALRTKRIWARAILELYHIEVVTIDRNIGTPHAVNVRNGPCLFLHLNQSSHIESPVVISTAHLPPFFLQNYEFSLVPFLGWNLWLTGVSIDRANSVQAQLGADEAIRLMKEEGKCCYMSIEGRRSEDGSLSPFKRGAAVMAISAQATIIPIITKGTRDTLPFGEWRVRPGKVEIIYDKVIPTVGMTLADRHRLTQHLWDIAVAELTPPGFVIPSDSYERERPKIPDVLTAATNTVIRPKANSSSPSSMPTEHLPSKL